MGSIVVLVHDLLAPERVTHHEAQLAAAVAQGNPVEGEGPCRYAHVLDGVAIDEQIDRARDNRLAVYCRQRKGYELLCCREVRSPGYSRHPQLRASGARLNQPVADSQQAVRGGKVSHERGFEANTLR